MVPSFLKVGFENLVERKIFENRKKFPLLDVWESRVVEFLVCFAFLWLFEKKLVIQHFLRLSRSRLFLDFPYYSTAGRLLY